MNNDKVNIPATVDLPSAKEVDKQIRALEKSISKLKISGTLDDAAMTGKNAFKHQVEAWIRINSNAKEFQERMHEILKQLDSANDNTAIQKLKNDFKEINAEAASSKVKGAFLSDAFKNSMQSLFKWTFDSSPMMQIINGIKNMGRAVYDIDTSMIDLYRVTDETEGKYSEFLTNSSQNAKDLGRNLSDTIHQATAWAKLGFNIDESTQLTKASSIYSNISEIDDNTAITELITTMKAFNIEADNSISIVDKLNKLENEFTTSAKNLGEGLSNSASAMALGGNSLEKTLALLAGGSKTTQEAGELGNTLKISQMRVLGMKEELEKLGEPIDENIDSISKMQAHILHLTNGKVDIFDSNNNLKDYYDILEIVSTIYGDLSSTKQTDLLTALFGSQRGNQGTALIQAFQTGQVQKALEATNHADGSAVLAQEKWMESLEAKTKQFEASFQSLSNTLIDSGLLKWFVDLGTNAISAIDKITGSLGPIGTLGAGAGLFAGIKNVGSPKMSGLIII